MTATMPLPTQAPVSTMNPTEIAKSTVVLQLEISVPSFKKKIDSKEVKRTDDDADSTMLHVHKDLIDRSAAEYTAITGAVSRLKNRWLRNRTVPCKVLKGGMYGIPVTLVGEVDAGIQNFINEEWRPLIEVLATKFETLKEEAQKRLGSHYDPSDYPGAEALKGKFKITVRWLSFNVPAALAELDKELFDRECQRAEAEWRQVSDDIRGALRESFAGLVEHLLDRLTPDEDGKPKKLHTTAVEQLQDFLSTFSARNLTNDAELAALAQRAQGIMRGVGVDQLRKQETTRARIVNGFSAMKEQLSGLVQKRGRSFEFDGDV